MYKHILIATDGSELAAKGVEQGLALASSLGAQVTVLSVTPPLDPRAVRAAHAVGVRDPIGRHDQDVNAELKVTFAGIEERAAAQGVKVDLMHEADDSPAEAIVRAVGLRGCDLIVMTSHGRRGAKRLILGSQTNEVLASAKTPVLVIR